MNGNGEGSLSNRRVRPRALVLRSRRFPALDDFNRANENPLSDAGRGRTASTARPRRASTSSNPAACSKTTTCTSWRNNAQYGPDTEAWARSDAARRRATSSVCTRGCSSRARRPRTGTCCARTSLPGTDEVYRACGQRRLRQLLTSTRSSSSATPCSCASRARRSRPGAARITWSRLGIVSDTTYAAAGYAGVGLRGTTGRLDDFGARTWAAHHPPGAPTTLGRALRRRRTLSWHAPTFDGGSRSPVPGRPRRGRRTRDCVASHVRRVLDSGSERARPTTTGVAAERRTRGPHSNVGLGDPPALVATDPSRFLVLDNFNRANENTLSGAGRWSNGVDGRPRRASSASNRLRARRRRVVPPGGTTPSSAPTARPGRGHDASGAENQLRLYVRIQQPGSLDGGRVHAPHEPACGHGRGLPGACRQLGLCQAADLSQELAAGDTLLLRVKGSSLEAWRPWLGVVAARQRQRHHLCGRGLRGGRFARHHRPRWTTSGRGHGCAAARHRAPGAPPT